jgi:hypothetical protein
MNTCTSAITILESDIKTERIEGLAMTNNGISIRFSIKNDPTNAAIFTPESQLIVNGSIRIGQEGEMKVGIYQVLGVIALPNAPVENEISHEEPYTNDPQTTIANYTADELNAMKIDRLKEITDSLGLMAIKHKKVLYIEAILSATSGDENADVAIDVEAEPVPF